MNPLSDWEGRYVKITINEVYKGRVLDYSEDCIYIEGPNEVRSWVHLTEVRNGGVSNKEYSIELSEPPMKNGYWQILDTDSVFEYRDGEWFYLSGDPLMTYTPDTSHGIKYLGSGE